MNHTTIRTLPFLLSFFMHAIADNNHSNYQKNRFHFFNPEYNEEIESRIKKQFNHTAKPILATTSIYCGVYLLKNTIQTVIDQQEEPQPNSTPGIILNTLVATGFIAAGSYVLKQIWDEKKPQ